MTVAEWILVAFLSVALLVFLILGIVLAAKFISISDEVKKIVVTGQGIADKADGVVGNVKDMTSFGGVIKAFADQYTKKKKGVKNDRTTTKKQD